jgi:hypothetical protein
MSEKIYQDSNYRFTDPVRFFKANDPYYFEVDNIPLKQLQENCNWLRDQVKKGSDKLQGVKRGDIDELKPYATGADRVIRVKPGRYSSRINDASTKQPLAYLEKIMGDAIGEVDAWTTVLPNPGSKLSNALLQAALDTFKNAVSSEAMGMTGLVERSFTWPVINSDTPIDSNGVKLANGMSYGGNDINIPGGGAAYSPMVITQALIWAKAQSGVGGGGTTPYVDAGEYLLNSFDINDSTNGWASLPRTESYFIKKWRGVSRLAIVDVSDEITIEVPSFDPDDFSYTNSEGTTTQVEGVESRIDLVFIYSKPVDSASVSILKPDGKQTITKPQLGIVRGAGIKTNYKGSSDFTKDYIENMGSEHKILAHPGDQKNTQMGFLATSSNDLAQDIRGTFPAPDDILNLAPLISEKLEDNAYELVGQSILPVAYIWVQNGSQVVLSTDVIDIRPLFRTAELAYNERAGIGAAFPQLSLANPAVGKGQLDYELKRVYDDLDGKVSTLASEAFNIGIGPVAMGYIYGGWNFGPEGALLDFELKKQGLPGDEAAAKKDVTERYSFGKQGVGAGTSKAVIPNDPGWDIAEWCTVLPEAGRYPNDRINTFISQQGADLNPNFSDASIVAGSNAEYTGLDGLNQNGQTPTKLKSFRNADSTNTAGQGQDNNSNVSFHFISKKIYFTYPSWMIDYKVDIDFINCVGMNYGGEAGATHHPGTYFGHWVEKGEDDSNSGTYFIIYVAFVADDNSNKNPGEAGFPAPSTKGVSERAGGKFSGFIVPVSDLITSNPDPISIGGPGGYEGNPRVGKCTYPTIMWTMTGVHYEAFHHLYGGHSQLGHLKSLNASPFYPAAPPPGS